MHFPHSIYQFGYNFNYFYRYYTRTDYIFGCSYQKVNNLIDDRWEADRQS